MVGAVSPLDRGSLAPRAHTYALIGLILAVATAGTLLTVCGRAPSTSVASEDRGVAIYLPTLAVEWGLVLYVARIGRPRSALASLIGRRWDSARRALGDLACALAGWSLILAVEVAFATITHGGTSASVTAMLPRTPIERVAWVAVAMSAGFCEEVVYRGYLQTQLTAMTGRAGVAIVLQGILFGIAHGEQGALAVVRLAIDGAALGVLARWRGSLWPCILCHAWSDLAAGLLR